MSTRFLFPLSAALILAAILLLLVRPASPPAPAESAARPESPAPPAAPAALAPPTLLPIAEAAASLNLPKSTPEDDLATLELLLSTFGRHHDGHPTGENVDIADALLGANPKRAAYLAPDPRYLNEAGEIIDRWGHPYFFHSLARDLTEIRSPGPDGELWTDDDVVLGSPG